LTSARHRRKTVANGGRGSSLQVPALFEYERATSIEHALELLAEGGPGARLLAGGHSLLPMMELRPASPEYLIDIRWAAEHSTQEVSG
jgi:aerobic carbon-monoxide dehydrogenase medium subunit